MLLPSSFKWVTKDSNKSPTGHRLITLLIYEQAAIEKKNRQDINGHTPTT